MSPSEPTGIPAVSDDAGSMRRLGRDAFIYGMGMVLSRAVSFIMLPVYTQYLTPADYGLLQLIQMTLDVAAILLSAGTVVGVPRFYFKAKEESERNGVVVTALLLLGGLNLLGAVILMPAAPLIWKYGLGSAGSPTLIRIAACSFVLEAAIIVPFLLMQLQRRATLYTVSSLAKLLLGLALNVLFVVGFGKGVGGILVANLITSVLVGAILLGWMLRRTGIRPTASAARDLRRFGVPYQFVTAGTFVLTFGDRFFLQGFHGLAVVGLYSLAYHFGFLLINLTSAPFFRAWTPQRLQLAVEAPAGVRDERYNQAFRLLNLVVITIATGMSLLAWPMLAVMSAPAFRPAAALVPLILAAFVVQIWTDTVALGIDVSEQTRYAGYATWIGVATILTLYAVLIPPLAGTGAALATLGGFLVRFAFFHRFAQRLWPVGWKWGQPVQLAAIGTGAVVFNLLVTSGGYVARLGIASGTFLAYAALVWLAVLSPEERRLLLDVVRAPRRAFAVMSSV